MTRDLLDISSLLDPWLKASSVKPKKADALKARAFQLLVQSFMGAERGVPAPSKEQKTLGTFFKNPILLQQLDLQTKS